MVPHSASPPPPEPRSLHPDTVTSLRTVIAERWRAVSDTESALAAVVARAAHEAREDGLRPEELIIALKRIEQDVLGAPGTLRATDIEARQRFREWLVTSCVRAYFAP
jgi:hypothetical protein